MSDGGFTPLTPIGGPSLEQEEKALRSGRGRMLAAMIVAVLAAGAGFAWFVSSSGPSEYGQLGRQINGMRAEHFDAFWACALPREDLRDLRNDQQLRSEIAERAAQPRAYAQHVRGQCMVHLDEHLPPLDALILPDDLQPGVRDLRTAVEAQRSAWSAFLARLDQTEGGFVAEDAEDELTAIARGWYEYKVAHSAINDVLRAHIDD
ncbi:hypothetical protein [Sandaracinus amylolyticus]|uniref:Uncharacterized protein n=1 Tax=Sandaracinus amylolyticus TaxID=927083 RepID=A0A0F6W7J8_9BACT|nr:hypothetical protein [Sandaracinus amylolyticus]AKF09283.1 hypothetical protein DB32_006432 [Sandaracinus amylolyticus]